MIHLLADMKGDLDWESQVEKAKNEAGPLYWALDFGGKFDPHDPLFYSSAVLAVEEFSKTVWPHFEERTAGVVLYNGGANFLESLVFSERAEVLFEEFVSQFPERFDRGHLEQLFAANLLSDLLHRLASFLPEEVKAICRIDASLVSDKAKFLHLICKRRFEHLHLEISGMDFKDSSTGISLPLDERLDPAAFVQLNALLEKGFRLIPEELLNENWDGLDRVIALRSYTSEWGMRMLHGFEAAGGEIAWE